jgi:hypothetical protein
MYLKLDNISLILNGLSQILKKIIIDRMPDIYLLNLIKIGSIKIKPFG